MNLIPRIQSDPKRDVNFVNNVIITLSDEKMTKIKIVDLDEFYNFYVHDFFQLKSFTTSKYCLNLLFFEIQIFN